MQNLGIDVQLPIVEKFDPPYRLLAGPGPGNAHPRVHAAMTLPQVPVLLGILFLDFKYFDIGV
jgi:hypothetical protein